MKHCYVEELERRQLMSISLASGNTASTFATGFDGATAMAFAPDGRVFVTEQSGDVKIVKSGAVLSSPFVSLTTNHDGERGLLGIAFDPNFATNKYVYLYYTATEPTIHNRLSRFTANGDVAEAGSEVVLLELPDLIATNHNGGAIHFGKDGKLYIAVGENGRSEFSQDLSSPFGKMLRMNSDGTIPSDNPFVGQDGVNPAIYAEGFRNPFTFTVDPSSGKIYVNDVGSVNFEELNELSAGADYGWPNSEGPNVNTGETAPLTSYEHFNGSAIIGGAFMADGNYYFGDLSGGFLRKYDPRTGSSSAFATGVGIMVGMERGSDGALYLLERDSPEGIVRIAGKISGDNTAPTASISGISTSFRYVAGKPLKLSFSAKDKEEKKLALGGYSYQIERVVNGVTQSTVATGAGVKTASYTIPTDTAALGVNVVYRATLTVTDSGGASTTVTKDVLPKVVSVQVRTTLPKKVALSVVPSITVDGTSLIFGESFQSVAGVTHQLLAPGTIQGTLVTEAATLAFSAWSGAGKSKTTSLTLIAPSKNSDVFAKYVVVTG